jgi:ribonuclease HII
MTQNILCAGVDEAGRGPLGGPVVAAAVILDPDHPIEGLADSKTLSKNALARLAPVIRDHAWVGIGISEPDEIDRLNILQATMTAMKRAVDNLPLLPSHALIDGNKIPPNLPCPAEAIIKGDAKVRAIGAASIIAKTLRDELMIIASLRFPGYGFETHKGYPSAVHREALQRVGPCPIHRMSYAPVRIARELHCATNANHCGKLDSVLTPR